MGDLTRHRVQLLEGNATVRRLMVGVLEEAGFEVLTAVDPEQSLAELLVVDVDSRVEGSQTSVDRYADQQLPVLVCGVRPSREQHGGGEWLERPFPPPILVKRCKALLGLDTEPSAEEDDENADNQSSAAAADATVERKREDTLDEHLDADADVTDEEVDASVADTDNLSPDAIDASVVDTDNLSADEADDFLELDTSSSIVLDVEDVEEAEEDLVSSARVVGSVGREAIDASQLDDSLDDIEAPRGLRSPTMNQTMPDAPAVMAPDETLDEASSESQRVESVRERASSSSHPSAAVLPPDLSRDIASVARLLADSWGRIGLAARPRDRAEHIERVLSALMGSGTAAAAAEIDRIPAAVGFSGSLEAITLVELLRTIRDRKLRGRLEVSVARNDFVLYLDGPILDDIENLAGSDDAMLLEMLLESGSISTDLYEELADELDDELSAPLEMRLRQEQLVPARDIKQARRGRAERLFEQLCASRGGSFAFMQVEQATGHAWPVDGLGLDVDALLLDLLREDSVDTEASRATTRSRLMVDHARVGQLDRTFLTDAEREVLDIFEEGKTVGQARQLFSGPQEEVDGIVDRLKQVQLLRRTDQSRVADAPDENADGVP